MRGVMVTLSLALAQAARAGHAEGVTAAHQTRGTHNTGMGALIAP